MPDELDASVVEHRPSYFRARVSMAASVGRVRELFAEYERCGKPEVHRRLRQAVEAASSIIEGNDPQSAAQAEAIMRTYWDRSSRRIAAYLETTRPEVDQLNDSDDLIDIFAAGIDDKDLRELQNRVGLARMVSLVPSLRSVIRW
jgi:hypothetical protein